MSTLLLSLRLPACLAAARAAARRLLPPPPPPPPLRVSPLFARFAAASSMCALLRRRS